MRYPELLIPVKGLADAKMRLGSLLDGAERGELVLAMLGDLLAATREAGLTAHVLSPDPDVLAFAEANEVQPLPEPLGASSLNDALEQAIASSFANSASVLIILGDTPLTTPAELRALLGLADQEPVNAACAIVVSDRTGRGTNALYLRPPGAVSLSFGVDSTTRHLESARAHGVPCEVERFQGLSLDLDTPEDAALLLGQPGTTRTHQLLRHFRVGERIDHARR